MSDNEKVARRLAIAAISGMLAGVGACGGAQEPASPAPGVVPTAAMGEKNHCSQTPPGAKHHCASTPDGKHACGSSGHHDHAPQPPPQPAPPATP